MSKRVRELERRRVDSDPSYVSPLNVFVTIALPSVVYQPVPGQNVKL